MDDIRKSLQIKLLTTPVSLRKVSKISGVPYSRIDHFKRGNGKPLSDEQVQAILKAFNTIKQSI